MPAYQNTGSIAALYPGDTVTVINAEQPATGIQSVQVALAQNPNGGQQKLSVAVSFAAAPGAFEIDLQTADVDLPGNYVSEAVVINAVNASNEARVEFPNIVAKFALLKTVAQNSNAVNCTATITR